MRNRTFLTRSAVAIAIGAIMLSGAVPATAGPEDDLRALLLRADNVVAAGIGPTSIFVAWTDRSLIETSYRIEIATDEAGPYTQAAIAPACQNSVADIKLQPLEVGKVCATQIQTGPAADPNPRFLRVVPLLDINGNILLEGVPSQPDPAILGPLPATNLRCNGGGDTACLNVNSVTLTWQDNSDEAEFWIMRAKGQFNPDFGTTPHAIVPANTTIFQEYLTEFSTTYYYRVVAVRRQNIPRLDNSVTVEQSFSNSLQTGNLLDKVKVETAPVPPPSDPTGLSVQFIAPSTARLTWTDQANPNLPYVDEDGWFIDWGTSVSTFKFTHTKIRNPGQGAVAYEDKEVPPDTVRCFRVRGWRSGPAYSGFTNVACIGSIPKRPTGLIATALDNATVNLAWTDNSDAETRFVVQRCNGVCTNSSTWTDIGDVPANTRTFTDNNVVSLTTYSYRVFSENSSGRSAPSNIPSVTTPVSPILAPTGLVANPTGSHEITLSFVDNATSETGFRIEYKRDGIWGTLDEIGPRAGTGGVTYVDDRSLAANEKRCYRVRATKVAKVSDPSNVACAITLPALAPNGAPSDLTFDVVSNVRIDLQWRDNASNEDTFRIETVAFPNLDCPQTVTGFPFAKIAEAPKRADIGITNSEVRGLQPHTAYFFRVVAVNRDGESGPSNVAGCAQTLGPPIPVFVDPAETGDVEATRCDVTIRTPMGPTGHTGHAVDRVKLLVNAFVPSTGVGHTDAVWIEDPTTAGGDQWVANYKFRRGITYRLIAQSFGPAPTAYHSYTAEIRDVTVLADCPIDF